MVIDLEHYEFILFITLVPTAIAYLYDFVAYKACILKSKDEKTFIRFASLDGNSLTKPIGLLIMLLVNLHALTRFINFGWDLWAVFWCVNCYIYLCVHELLVKKIKSHFSKSYAGLIAVNAFKVYFISSLVLLFLWYMVLPLLPIPEK